MVGEAGTGTGGGDKYDVVTDFGERRERGVLTEKKRCTLVLLTCLF